MVSELEDIIPPLLYWYSGAARVLPWRSDPTPYHVWISEIMLQQTRVEAVKDYYTRFMEALPTPLALAACDGEELNKLWQGLGYYSRARNLKRAAEQIRDLWGGELPDTYDALRALPGVGAYTAGAIASIAFGLPEPAVDGNVLRVITRLTRNPEDIMKQSTKDVVTEALRRVYPSGEDASALTQALMELGATVCVPNGAPHCTECPLREMCQAHEAGDELSYPVKTPKKERTVMERSVFLVRCGEKYALRKRADKGLLAGLWEFPAAEQHLDENGVSVWAEENGLALCGPCVSVGEAKHIFTHIEWRMRIFEIPVKEENNAFVFADKAAIRDIYCVPSAFKAMLGYIEKH